MASVCFSPRLAARILPAASLFLAAGLFAQPRAQTPPPPAAPNPLPKAGEWQTMFDGKTLGGWKETPFSGRGKVTIQNGAINLGSGAMTGVNWTGWFPKFNYELRVEAQRVNGRDFFASITFPIGEFFLTWVNGGWGGSVVGISSIDSADASENETATIVPFLNGQWYTLLLRVANDSVQASIDGENMINIYLVGRQLSLRPGEIELSVPLGICSYSTTGAIRKIEYRLLDPDAQQ
jgi:hypothetical protein